MRKNYIVITGGAGFIGSNLIKYLINKTNFNIISLGGLFQLVFYAFIGQVGNI